MAFNGSGWSIQRWIGVWGLGVALLGCGNQQEKAPKPQVNKQDLAACAARCEELAQAEESTCTKPVLEPQACHKAVQLAEADCKSVCDPSNPPLGE